MPAGKVYLAAPRKTFKKKPSMPKKDHALLKKVARRVFSENDRLTLGLYKTITTIAPVFDQFNLSKITGSDLIFGTDSADLESQKIKHLNTRLSLYVRLGSEDDGVDMTIFLVRPKKSFKGFNATTGILTLNINEDYYVTGGMVFLNPDSFTTVWRKELHLYRSGIDAVSVGDQSIDGTDFSIKNKVIKMNKTIINTGGDVSGLSYPINAEDNLVLLNFNNNSSADLESPYWQLQAINRYVALT